MYGFIAKLAGNEWINDNLEREVHFVKEGWILTKDSKSHEKLVWNMKVSISQFYSDNLSEEVKKGQREKIAQGGFPTKPPIGYKTIGDKGHKIHVIDPEKAPLVKRMFELYSTGNYSLNTLVEMMHKEGLRNRMGGKIGKSRMHEHLSNPFYYGKMRWNNEIYSGQHQPLISKDVFERVQKLMKGNITPKYSKHLFLFKGLIRCEECGRVITWEKQKGIIYGHCNHYRNCSQKVWVKEPEIEEQIAEFLTGLQIKSPRLIEWIRKALKESHKDEIEYHTTALNELSQKHEQIQKRIDRLYDDKLDDKITKEFYEMKFKQYSDEKGKITESIKNHSQASNQYFELGINIYELSQKAKEIYFKAVEDEKRQLINLVFDKLSVKDGIITANYSKPFELLSEAVKVTNCSKASNLAESSEKIFEPAKFGSNKSKNRALYPAFDALLREQDSNL